MDERIIKLLCLIFIFIVHFGILNRLEKCFTKITFEDNPIINRPLEQCKNSNDKYIYCIGMPSGHTEVTTIISLILYYYNIIPLQIALGIIILMGLQRLLTKKHTILQVLVGFLLGLVYTYFYIATDVSLNSMLIMFVFVVLLILIMTLYVDDIIKNDKIPDWVDKNMYSTIEKKKNTPFYLKFSTMVVGLILEDNPLYIDWNTIEIYLDKIIEKIKQSNMKYDAIIGLKSGGAILSNYIARKLNIPNYTAKITSKNKKCKSDEIKMIDYTIDVHIKKLKKSHKLCEGIKSNLENKNVILIDELVHTGASMEFMCNYLLNEKKVKNIFLSTITSTLGPIKINNIQLHAAVDYKYSFVYPWGV
jgi:hypoxanthine phosphoribosyltransferase